MLTELAKIIDATSLLQYYVVLENLETKDPHIKKMLEIILNSKAIQHTPLSRAPTSDNVSQLKLRYEQIITNRSPANT